MKFNTFDILFLVSFVLFLSYLYTNFKKNTHPHQDYIHRNKIDSKLVNEQKKYRKHGYIDKKLLYETEHMYPNLKNPLLPNKSFEDPEYPDITYLQNDHFIFNKHENLRNDIENNCSKIAKKQCKIPRLSTRTDCYLQQDYEEPGAITRNHQLLGSSEAYEQRTNNYESKGKCDCSNRNYELCQDDELISEKCFQDKYTKCLQSEQ